MKEIFEKIDKFAELGFIIDVVAMNQKENGNNHLSLISYTVEVMDYDLTKMFYSESYNTFKEALFSGIKWTEKYITSKT